MNLDHGLTTRGAHTDAGGGVVVEALRIADVLESNGEAHTAFYSLAVRRIRHSAGERAEIQASCVAFGRERHGPDPVEQLGDGRRPLDGLTGGKYGSLAHRVPDAEVERIDPQRVGELVHLTLVCEAGLHRTEPSHRTARRVVRVRDERIDSRVRDVVGPARETRGVAYGRGRRRCIGASLDYDALF